MVSKQKKLNSTWHGKDSNKIRQYCSLRWIFLVVPLPMSLYFFGLQYKIANSMGESAGFPRYFSRGNSKLATWHFYRTAINGNRKSWTGLSPKVWVWSDGVAVELARKATPSLQNHSSGRSVSLDMTIFASHLNLCTGIDIEHWEDEILLYRGMS